MRRARQNGGNYAGSPNSDGPGNAAWQDATAALANVQTTEARRP